MLDGAAFKLVPFVDVTDARNAWALGASQALTSKRVVIHLPL
jgi:hypothetical protein